MRLIAAFVLASAVVAQTPSSPRMAPTVFSAEAGVARPRCDMVDPQYTAEARRQRIKGTVVVSATVATDGCLENVKVVRKLGYGLDEAALDALRFWRCTPKLHDGKPAEVPINIELNFDPRWGHGSGGGGKRCEETAERTLRQRVLPADPTKYKDIRDGASWANPFLLVRRGGVEIIGVTDVGNGIPIDRVEGVLLRLPDSAWPYGLVVAVQENGIRAPGDDAPIRAIREKLLALLKRLGIAADLWPSA